MKFEKLFTNKFAHLNVDSDEGENEIAPFKNIINEFYAKDIIKKCRSSYRIRGSSDIPLGRPLVWIYEIS